MNNPNEMDKLKAALSAAKRAHARTRDRWSQIESIENIIRRMNQYPEWLRAAASKGGKAGTGKSKARSSAQARKAARVRWDKAKANK